MDGTFDDQYDNSPSRIQLSSSEDTIDEISNDEDSIHTPVATPLLDIGSETSSVMDAACVLKIAF